MDESQRALSPSLMEHLYGGYEVRIFDTARGEARLPLHPTHSTHQRAEQRTKMTTFVATTDTQRADALLVQELKIAKAQFNLGILKFQHYLLVETSAWRICWASDSGKPRAICTCPECKQNRADTIFFHLDVNNTDGAILRLKTNLSNSHLRKHANELIKGL
jgi:hypothetical protein